MIHIAAGVFLGLIAYTIAMGWWERRRERRRAAAWEARKRQLLETNRSARPTASSPARTGEWGWKRTLSAIGMAFAAATVLMLFLATH